ncbi:MAG: tRNA pseudouridine(38-40) synthase TruA [Pseudomonadota bacterium]
MRYRLTIAYDGTDFAGWQRQAGARTVQGEIEAAFARVFGSAITVNGSGRTDSGVHAAGQVAHVDIEKDVPPHRLCMALNAHLRGMGIGVLSAQKTAPDFHARFSARRRFYDYRLVNRAAPPVFLSRYAWHVPQKIDCAIMGESAKTLLGTHDFSAFRAARCGAKSPIKTLENFSITQDENVIRLSFMARSFLYRQVRLMVGTLVGIGRGKYPPDHIAHVLASRDHARAGPTAPARGLTLTGVCYDRDPAGA